MIPIRPDSEGKLRLPAHGSVVLLHFGDTGDTVLARYYSEHKLLDGPAGHGASHGLFVEAQAQQAGRDLSEHYPVETCLERNALWQVVETPATINLNRIFSGTATTKVVSLDAARNARRDNRESNDGWVYADKQVPPAFMPILATDGERLIFGYYDPDDQAIFSAAAQVSKGELEQEVIDLEDARARGRVQWRSVHLPENNSFFMAHHTGYGLALRAGAKFVMRILKAKGDESLKYIVSQYSASS